MKIIKTALLLFIGLYPNFTALARHIVGGELYYTWMRREGNDNHYRFNLNVYIDCNPNAQRTFEQVVALSIYLKSSGTLVDNTLVNIGERSRVLPPDNPCLIPPNICVAKGVYEWDRKLPLIEDTYIVMYQVCCRNETTNNLIQPGQIGNTYTVEITPESQRLNNSSPQFLSFPPTVICLSEPLSYDHSVIDKEGDVVVYHFCTPLGGGGLALGFGCFQTTPNPACWPTNEVSFRQPYTANNPIGGDPPIKIDSRTGLITGKPLLQGQFALAVCIEEYRNGKLLSIVKRDFQFNVAPCTPVVQGRIKADEIVNDLYILKSCGNLSFQIDNQSVEQKNIRSVRFDVNIKGEKKQFTDWNPIIAFPDTGIYSGKLVLNQGGQCSDSIDLEFRISPSIKADFTFQFDSCKASPVRFTNKTVYTPNDGIKWLWDFGYKRDSVENPVTTLSEAGNPIVTLRATNKFSCFSEMTKTFRYAPLPEQLALSPDIALSCTPAVVNFRNLTKPIDSTYNIKWDFGDGNTSLKLNPQHTYEKTGNYNVTLSVVSPLGCSISQVFNNAVKVRPGIKADFRYTPEIVNSENKTIDLISTSAGAISWGWYYRNRLFGTDEAERLTFRDTGIQKVTLFVANIHECKDSLTKTIDVEPLVTYFLPNAFSPNFDGVNDIYVGKGITEGVLSFNMKIFNRWGEMIFETDDPNKGWDGRKHNNPDIVQEGVYLCLVNYITPRGQRREIRSYATLIK